MTNAQISDRWEPFIRGLVQSGRYVFADTVIDEALRLLSERDQQSGMVDQARPAASDPVPAWRRVPENMREVPDEVFDRIPADSSEQLDHYLYGVAGGNAGLSAAPRRREDSQYFLSWRVVMSTVRAIVEGGRIEVEAPGELPDGTEVLVEVTPLSREKIGIHESEWRDDPEALADWESWIKRIEPIELGPEESADRDRFEAEFRRYNIEAVRKQMEEGAPG